MTSKVYDEGLTHFVDGFSEKESAHLRADKDNYWRPVCTCVYDMQYS